MTEAQGQGPDRRGFLGWIGLGGVAATLMATAGATLRYLFPAVFYEPSQATKVGRPAAFAEGTTQFLPKAKVFMHHTPEGFYAITGHIKSLRLSRRGRRNVLRGTITDDTGSVEAVWFNQGYYREGTPATFHKSPENYLTVSAGTLIIRMVYVAVENYHLLTGFECKSCFRE